MISSCPDFKWLTESRVCVLELIADMLQDLYQFQRMLLPCLDPLERLIDSQRVRESSKSSVQRMIQLFKDKLLSVS